ncbi:MAG: B12 lower ligand biosynthesis radical SAM protein BzaD [Thermacetogeniaceae bacterium]
MRVLLVQTPSVEVYSEEKVYPIGIVVLAGQLRSLGYDVRILDMNLDPEPFGRLRKQLLDFHPDVVGLSLRNIDPLGNKTSSLMPQFIAAVKLVAALLPDAWLIVGGTGFSLFPERILLEVPELDYGIVGEAERSFPALLRSLENPSGIPGLCYRELGGVRVLAPDRSIDMLEYSIPDRKLWEPSSYLEINSYVPAIGVEAKRGCPYSCAYCVYPQLQGKRLRCRSPVAVVNEIEYLHKEFGVQRFHFTDPVLNIPEGYLEEICKEILRRKLEVRWNGFFREDQLNAENIALFETAGCECFSFSPDGLSQKALDVLRKGLTEADILRAAELASRREAISVYHFMVNVPGETEETVKRGLEMLERIYELHARKRNLGTVVLNNIRILPGTEIERIARAEGVISPDTDLLYPVYYNPRPFETLRYQLEAFSLCRNVFMWGGIGVYYESAVAGTPKKDCSREV